MRKSLHPETHAEAAKYPELELAWISKLLYARDKERTEEAAWVANWLKHPPTFTIHDPLPRSAKFDPYRKQRCWHSSACWLPKGHAGLHYNPNCAEVVHTKPWSDNQKPWSDNKLSFEDHFEKLQEVQSYINAN